MVSNKIQKIQKISALVSIVILGVIAGILFSPHSAQAYKCHESDYYDNGQCYTYKEVTGNYDGAGKLLCPTDSFESSGKCFTKGGDKQNYAPTNDDGSAIDTSNIVCNSYHAHLTGSSTSTDIPTRYDPGQHTCVTDCSNVPWYSYGPAEIAACSNGKVAPTIRDPNNPNASTDPNNPTNPTATTPPVAPDDPASKETFGSCGQHGSDNQDVKTVLIGCDQSSCGNANNNKDGFKGTPVIGCVLRMGITALTVLIGVGAVAGIAWEALKYARAQDDQSLVSQAKNRIRDIIIGLVVYIFMIAVINWLVPGGIIG